MDKNHMPDESEIEKFIGNESSTRLQTLDKQLQYKYTINCELRNPFGNSYGWGFKYSHKTKHLFYLFFEGDALTATIQIGDKDVPKLLEQYNLFSLKAQSYWENRYPCGKNGGWIHYRIQSDDELEDVLRFIAVKKTPINNVNKKS